MKFGYNYEKEYYKKMKKKLQDQKRIGNRNPHLQHEFEKAHQNSNRYRLEELVKAPNSRARSEAVGVKVNYDKPQGSSIDLVTSVSYIKNEDSLVQRKEKTGTSSKALLKRLTSH